MSALISVIVPVYKVEAYLKKCVDSIVNQTYKNLEIILVDDGSPDGCPKLCDDLAKRDERIVVIHKENGGLSSARNAGIDVARGAYIGFVDSDDYIHPEMYERLYASIVNAHADLCICSCQKINKLGEKISKDSPLKDEVLSRGQCFSKIFLSNGWYYVTVPMKLYKRELFTGLRFNNGKLHEDEFFIHHLIGKCNTIVTIPDELYMYIKRDDSIMHTLSAKNYLYMMDAYLDRYTFFRESQHYEFAQKSIMSAYGSAVRFIQSGTTKEHKIEFRKRIRLILIALLRFRNLRAIKLLYLYARYVG